MQNLPDETFGVFGEFLTLADILSLASTNRDIYDIFLKPEINKQLADYYGFPYGLSLTELKIYETMSFDERIRAATATGDIRIINKFIEYYEDDTEILLFIASYHGHENIVNKMMELGANDFSMGMINAAKGGHLHLFNKFVSLLQKSDSLDEGDLDISMYNAAWNGHNILIDRCIELGANDFIKSLKFAAKGGHLDTLNKLVEILKEKSQLNVNVLNTTLITAASNGYEPLVDRLIELGAKDFKSAFLRAARNGHPSIVKKLTKLNVSHIQEAILAAIDNDHTEVANLLIQYAVDHEINTLNLYRILNEAVTKDNIEIAKKVLDLGIRDIQYAIIIANLKKSNDMIQLLNQYV